MCIYIQPVTSPEVREHADIGKYSSTQLMHLEYIKTTTGIITPYSKGPSNRLRSEPVDDSLQLPRTSHQAPRFKRPSRDWPILGLVSCFPARTIKAEDKESKGNDT